ncbi:glycoside hydrolase N-terminal domain-containing protein [Planctomycetota bacterium]
MRTCYTSILIMLVFAGAVYSQDRPNVIFVMPDDISHNAFSYYKENGLRTPHIDQLAKSSVRLTDFHVSPSCSPTRAALLTGRPSDVVGVWHTINGRNMLRADEITMADIFKANGYATGLFFKWHLGDNYPFRPKDRGFEYVAWTKGGGTGQQPDYWGNTNNSASMWVNDRLVKMTDEDDGIEGAFTTNFFFNRAMEFMDENIQKNKPFFAYIPTATAHAPHVLPPDAREGVSAKTGTIENIDKNMGRLIKFLDDRGIADNTILIFTTDNGSNTFLRGGKGSNYDGGTRVPCFVRWEAGGLGGEGKGRDVEPLTAHIDWLPTFMDILDLKDVPNRPEKLKIRGRSFKPFLDNDPSNDPADYKNRAVIINDMWTEFPEKYKKLSVKRDIWDGDRIIHKWRLTRTSSRSDWELYDVLGDIVQKDNLIKIAEYKDIVAKLKQEYEQWWQLVEERSDEYTRIIIGHPEEPETDLHAHDFHGTVIWNQANVIQGSKGSGFIAVEFEKTGAYHFDLRRWPKEIEDQTTITSGYSDRVYDSKDRPAALDIASARIKIWNGDKVYVDEKKKADPNADGVEFTIDKLPKGPAFIQTWFYNSAGQMAGAVYYNYASLDQVSKTDVTISSISELRVAMAQSDQTVTMTPGTYTVKDRHDATTVFKFSGSNNTFKFTGVTLLIPTELLATMDFNPIHAHVSYLLTGSHITFIDGTFEDVYSNGMNDATDFVEYNQREDYAPARQMTEFKLDGDNITFNGCTITVRGSYPYGYGDMWGKGRGAVVKLKKHAGINVNGANCTFEGVSLSVLAYGHGIFMQSRADNTVINNCSLQGRVRLGEEMYQEKEGSLPHKHDYTVKFGYLNGKAIPRNKMFALTEDGIRNYKGVGKITVKNTTVTNFRGGMSLATGGVAHVENVDLINCEHGYTLPGNSKVINCTGDASYGPVINCPYPQNSNDVYDIKIIDRPSTGDHHLADIVGSNLKIKFTYEGGMPEILRPIVLGQRQGGGTGRASGINITNGTPHPILIKSQGSNATGTCSGMVTDNGTGNNIVYSPYKFSKRDMVLWYNEPGEGWSDAALIGNGYMGARVFGDVQNERIALNEGTFWSGRPHDYANPEGLEYFPKIRDLVFAEKFQEAEKMADEHFFGIPKWQHAFMPIGDLMLSFNGAGNVTDYYRELDMETGVAKLTYSDGDANFTREIFMSYPDRVMVVRLTCDKPGKLSVEAKIKSAFLEETVSKPGKLVINGTCKGPLPYRKGNALFEGTGISFQTALLAYPEKGEFGLSDSSMIINNANSIILVLTSATSYKNYKDISGDPAKAVEAILSAVEGKDYKTLRQRHEDDFSSLMGRVNLTIGADTMNSIPTDERLRLVAEGGTDMNLAGKLFQFGRYMLVSSSRPGGQPANLQGIWNEDLNPPWGSKYTMNINTEMNYWPAEVTNLSECHLPLFKAMEELAESGARTAKVQYGAYGWVVHHNFDLWRGTAPVDAALYGMWPIGGGWLCHHIWEHYLYTGDKEFLKEYYPVMKGYAEFLMDIMEVHPKYKWLVIPFSMSPEHGYFTSEDAKEARLTPSTMLDIGVINDLFPNCIEASNILGIDADFSADLAKALKQIPPYQIDSKGRPQEWIEDWIKGDQGHNCSSHWPFFPGYSLTLRENPDFAEAYKVFLAPGGSSDSRRVAESRPPRVGEGAERRRGAGEGRRRRVGGGWRGAWDICMWARLENGEMTDEFLTGALSGRRGSNLHSDGFNQSDANFGFTAAVAECLLQSHAGEISLLPALPVSWTEGSVTGLRARGGYEVDVEWKEGKLVECKVKSLLGKPFTIRYGNHTAKYSLPAGKTIKISGTRFYQ